MKPLRHRLTLLLVGGLAALVISGGAVLYPAVRAILIAEFDYALLAKARALTALPGPERQGVNLNFTEGLLPEFQPGPDAEYFQVWLNDGSVLAQSPSLVESSLPFPARHVAEPQFQNLALPNGPAIRAVVLGLLSDADDPAEGPAFIIAFARERARLDHAVNSLLAGLVLGGAALIGLAAWLVRRTVRSGLQPVDALARQVTRVGAQSLDTRFAVVELPEELRPIAAQLNALLDRLQAAFERERRFSANAAHELATPIAELRALAEVTLLASQPADAGLARDALDIARQMQRLVESLLALAQCEAVHTKPRMEQIDFSALLTEVSSSCAAQVMVKGLDWQISFPARTVVGSDATLLRSIATNLLENAAEYTPPGGRVYCGIDAGPGELTLRVANTNPGLTPEDIPLLFEPLWRKDAARTDGLHTGVGLAVVQLCAKRLGAEVRVALPDAGTVEFVFRLPVNGGERPEFPAPA